MSDNRREEGETLGEMISPLSLRDSEDRNGPKKEVFDVTITSLRQAVRDLDVPLVLEEHL